MTIAELCLLGMVLLTYLVLGPAKFAGLREFDNSYPRDPAFYSRGPRARALGAHQNGLEAFPLFAAAVLLAELHGAPQHMIDGLALAFLGATPKDADPRTADFNHSAHAVFDDSVLPRGAAVLAELARARLAAARG